MADASAPKVRPTRRRRARARNRPGRTAAGRRASRRRRSSFTGRPSSWAIATATPPFAVPSSFVSATPVRPRPPRRRAAPAGARSGRWSRRGRAASRAARPPACCAITRRTFASSSIRFVCVWRRPAVSTIDDVRARAPPPRRSRRRRPRPDRRPPLRADEVGAARGRPRSRAAPPPPRGTCPRPRGRPSGPTRRAGCASLPIVVVLPVPFTPTTRMTVGLARRAPAAPGPPR